MLNFLHKTNRFAWLALIALLPISSMPIVADLLHSDSVASPSIIFLVILSLTWFLPNLIKEQSFSSHIFPLLLFCLVALIATAFSVFIVIPGYKGFDQFTPLISSLGTLVIGCMFFICASSFLNTQEEAVLTFRVINWSGMVMLVWCFLQVFYWYGPNHYPQWMFDFQGFLSARVLYRQRINGFALEPSWLAHQLNMIYLPLWLACTLKKESFHTCRIWKFSFENLLLVGGVLALFFTLSRVGFAAFFAMLAIVAIILHKRIVMKIQWLLAQKCNTSKLPMGQGVITFLLLLAYGVLIAVVLVFFTRVDPRMESLFNYSFAQDNPLLRFFNELKFGDRVIYWLTGWNIFNAYPLLGVGLGNAGFYFPKLLPAYGWSLVEVMRLLNRSKLLLNIKSLWLRLLAETGIIGFSFFLGWLFSLIPTIIEKARSEEKLKAITGLMGCLTLAALIFEGFSVDSFAMPYWWVSLGLAIFKFENHSNTKQI